MSESQLVLTAEEHKFLVDLLETTLKHTLVEEHQTRSPNYREHIIGREHLIAALLSKLGQPSQ